MANFQSNARAKNAVQVGNNEKFFDEWKHIISVNDGKRQCGQYVANCHDQQAPFAFSQKTQINITNKTFDITNIRKGFFTAKIRTKVQIMGLTAAMATATGDKDHLAKAFIGYKASVQSLDRMTIWHNGKELSYNNQYLPEEGFCFASLRSSLMRERKRYIHTLYENARDYLPDVAGTYINLADFADGAPHWVEFEINVPIIDLLAFQCFDKWLKDMGELIMEVYFTHRSMVFTTCSARSVLDVKRFLEDNTLTTTTLAGTLDNYSHKFTQIGDPCISYVNVAYAGTTSTFTTGEITPIVAESWVNELKSTIRGYGITDRAKAAILGKLRMEPLRIPSQEIMRKPFPQGPTVNGLNTNLNIPFPNVSCVGLVFPKTAHQLTVFENPMLQGLQVKIAGITYPNEKYSTLGARFLQEQLNIADLDGAMLATEELNASYTDSKNRPEDGTRYGNSKTDDTAFIALIETERGDAGYTFDGLDYKDNVSFELTASPIHTGANDTYLYPIAGGPKNDCVPVAYLCCDTYFEHDGVSFTYCKDTPVGSQSG
jgi:hypothetical protein